MTIEPYNYNDESSGRTDTLTQALEKCERLEKQLKIVIEVLWKVCDGRDDKEYYSDMALETLQQIKELEK